MIIAIIGVDGSGKSTTIKLLERHFINKGYKVKIEYPFNYFLLRKILDKINKKNSNDDNKKNNSRKILKIWPFISLIDNWIFYLLRLKKKNKIILCDRYFYDLATSFLEFNYANNLIYNWYIRLIPKADFVFALDCNENIAKGREQDDDHSLSFFERQRNRYQKLSQKKYCEIINSENFSPKEIIKKITRKIERQ